MGQINGKEVISAGLELGGTYSHAAFILADGGYELRELVDISPGTEPANALLEAIEQIRPFVAADKKFNLGIAVPGLVDFETGHVVHSAMGNVHIPDEVLNGSVGADDFSIVIENDANAAALAELTFGAGRGVENMFYATLGEGIGGALVIGGRLWRGDSGFAGEIGNIAINSEGMRLEEIASAKNIIRRTRNRIHQDSTSSLSRLNEDEIDIEAIVRAAEAEDDFALLMLERTGTYVGAAIAAVINVVNIEQIVIGGSLVDKNGVVLAAVTRRVSELAYAPALKRTSIISGQLGEEAAAVGAALTAAAAN